MAMTDRRLTADEYLALPLAGRHTQLVKEIYLGYAARQKLTTPLLPGFVLDVGALLDR